MYRIKCVEYSPSVVHSAFFPLHSSKARQTHHHHHLFLPYFMLLVSPGARLVFSMSFGGSGFWRLLASGDW